MLGRVNTEGKRDKKNQVNEKQRERERETQRLREREREERGVMLESPLPGKMKEMC